MKQATRYSSRPLSDDPRDTEAWALTEAARRLIDASRDPQNEAALQAALQLNQRLWTIFQASITEPDCELPRPIRENIAALSLLVDRQTMARLVDLDATKLDTLIQINRAVASGLSQRPAGAASHQQGHQQGIPQTSVMQPPQQEIPKPMERLRISI